MFEPLKDPADGLFAYGTLRIPEVLEALLGRVPTLDPATAAGWRVAALPGLTYPGLVEAPDGTADGMLLRGLRSEEWRILHEYEEDLYDLRLVALDGGRRAWTYVWVDAADAHDWDLTAFDLPTYLRTMAD
ncbi:MAG: gamma-glutamylcyclotransferase family protein [Streptosporangiaceae bacterium]